MYDTGCRSERLKFDYNNKPRERSPSCRTLRTRPDDMPVQCTPYPDNVNYEKQSIIVPGTKQPGQTGASHVRLSHVAGCH